VPRGRGGDCVRGGDELGEAHAISIAQGDDGLARPYGMTGPRFVPSFPQGTPGTTGWFDPL
jgi:hypothetical protein